MPGEKGANLSPQLTAAIAKRILLVKNKDTRNKLKEKFEKWIRGLGGNNIVKTAIQEAYGCQPKDHPPPHNKNGKRVKPRNKTN